MIRMQAPAKINICLSVGEARPDGYHDIRTLFAAVSLCDYLTVGESGSFSLECPDPDVPTGPENLVSRAYELVSRDYAIPPVSVFLEKNIPMGGGLGGGSSDGAAMLRALNTLFTLKIPESRLREYALELGSDAPFFLTGGLCLAAGRGEELERIPADLSGLLVVLATPGIHVPTRQAYAALDLEPARHACDFEAVISELAQEIPVLQPLAVNDFETPVFRMHPLLRTLKETFIASGALVSMMSGSGSCVYGIYRKERPPVPEIFGVTATRVCRFLDYGVRTVL